MISKYHRQEILDGYEELVAALRECDAAIGFILDRIGDAASRVNKIEAALQPYGLSLSTTSGVRLQQPTHVSVAVFGRISHLLRGLNSSYHLLLATQLKHDESLCANAEHDQQQLEQTFTYLAQRAELANRH